VFTAKKYLSGNHKQEDMKTNMRILLLIFAFLVFNTLSVLADAPPDPGGGPGGGDGPVGGGSPIGGSAIVFLIMSLIYGIRKSIIRVKQYH
jgi:hypothetical protein